MKTASASAASLLAACVLGTACDTPEQPPLGGLTITTSAPTIEGSFATVDGWTVKYTRFLVNVSEITVAGYDGVVTASATAQIVDQAAPPPKVLLTADNRVARAWEDVSFVIGPTTEESSPLEPVTETDRRALAAGGTSVYVEGSMTRGAVTKQFSWGLSPETRYASCTARQSTGTLPGLVVPPNGADSADVVMDGSALFFDNLAARGHVLRGDPIAAADANGDGVVQLGELAAVSLDVARQSSGLYGPLPGVDDLAAYLNAQARSIVVSFRAEGGCVIDPVDNAP